MGVCYFTPIYLYTHSFLFVVCRCVREGLSERNGVQCVKHQRERRVVPEVESAVAQVSKLHGRGGAEGAEQVAVLSRFGALQPSLEARMQKYTLKEATQKATLAEYSLACLHEDEKRWPRRKLDTL